MNERKQDLGKALLATDVGTIPESDPRRLTLNALRRDKRRVQMLAALTVFFWLLSAGGMMYVTYVYFDLLTRRTDLILVGLEPDEKKTQAERREWAREMYSVLREIAEVGMWAVWSCIAALTLAALTTVLLVFSSRRATLRQVNANLIAISEQLRQRQSSGRGAGH